MDTELRYGYNQDREDKERKQAYRKCFGNLLEACGISRDRLEHPERFVPLTSKSLLKSVKETTERHDKNYKDMVAELQDRLNSI
jgi:hypothetical protein